jgi:hypothetical protein
MDIKVERLNSANAIIDATITFADFEQTLHLSGSLLLILHAI